MAAVLPVAVPAQESVCARVKLEIQQQLTLEREAFEARMTIQNGVAGVSIEDIRVEVSFADTERKPVRATGDPNDLTAQFFYRFQDGSSLPSSLPGGTGNTTKWLIIPAPGAAGTGAQGALYYVGATLRYRAAGEEQVVVVDPDDITVKPMPALTLDYFLPKEVYGDDPFTDTIVEPPIPFTLGVRVRNTGVGPARRLRIDSAQPRIVENRLGLLAQFVLQGCEMNGGVAESTLLADFGDIPPNRSGVARWLMTSSLSGEFVEFTAYYTHADELGGQLTSLITAQPRTHILLQNVLVDLPGRDGVRDFLARDGDELRVHESENLDTVVTDESARSTLIADGGRYRIRTAAAAGFRYVRLPDPLGGRQVLQSVERADGRRMAGPNGWLSQTWDRAGRRWDHFVNVFDTDNAAGADYLLQYKGGAPRTNRPPVLDPVSNRLVGPGDRLTFPVTASDPDGDRLAFRLESGAPAGASLTADGIFSWEPGSVPVPSTNRLTVVVTDQGLPALSDRRGFSVVVRDPAASRPPQLVLSRSSMAYAEGAGRVRLDPEARVIDDDTPVWEGGRLTVTVLEGGSASDRLTLAAPSDTQTNVTVSAEGIVQYRSLPIGQFMTPDGDPRMVWVDFNANAALAMVQEVVRVVEFENMEHRGASPSRVVQFQVEDGRGGVGAPEDLELSVVPANRAPTAAADEAGTTADTPIPLSLLKLVGNDVDPDGDPLTFELLNSVTEQRGLVELVGQTVVYIPDPLLRGVDSFRYRVTDPYGGWAEAQVQVTVREPSAPSRSIIWIEPGPDGSVRLKMQGIPRRTYTVQWSIDLLYWTDLMRVTAGPTGEIEFTDKPTEVSRLFYRIAYP